MTKQKACYRVLLLLSGLCSLGVQADISLSQNVQMHQALEEKMQTLIVQQQTRILPTDNAHPSDAQALRPVQQNSPAILSYFDFEQWLKGPPSHVRKVSQYRLYLARKVGANNVPPMSQLLTTARSWEKCGQDPYQLPPQELWANILPTLELYRLLKVHGIVPLDAEIRSVYRPPELNECAGGAASSKHLFNSAIDIWVPQYEYKPWKIPPMQDRLCQFWFRYGEQFDFGLGLYATGSIHIDAQGFRKWGALNDTALTSPCRLPKPQS